MKFIQFYLMAYPHKVLELDKKVPWLK